MELFFFKGNQNIIEEIKGKAEEGLTDEEAKIELQLKKIQDTFLKVLDNKNLSFLLGSGCSSYKLETDDFKEIGISVMAPLAEEFYSLSNFKDQKEWLETELEIDVSDSNFAENLETFLSTLHSLSYYHSQKKAGSKKEQNKTDRKFPDLTEAEKIDFIISQARNFLLEKCLNSENAKTEKEKDSIDKPLIEL